MRQLDRSQRLVVDFLVRELAQLAVSRGSKRDVLSAYPTLDEAKVHVVHNGIDTDCYRPDPDTDVLERLGVDPCAAVGRVRRPHHASEGRSPPTTCCAGLR